MTDLKTQSGITSVEETCRRFCAALSKVLALMASLALLIYLIHGLVAGKVRIKGITFTINEPVAFSFNVAPISNFALMAPLLVLSPSLLLRQ